MHKQIRSSAFLFSVFIDYLTFEAQYTLYITSFKEHYASTDAYNISLVYA